MMMKRIVVERDKVEAELEEHSIDLTIMWEICRDLLVLMNELRHQDHQL